MQARRKPADAAPPPPAPADDGVKRPRQLLLVALVICGLWPQLWLAMIGLIPIAFIVTWDGRWERRHSVMALGALAWILVTIPQLAGDKDRASLGLGGWNPPDWLVTLGSQNSFLLLLGQALGLGLLTWAADGMRSFKQLTQK